MRGTRKQKKTFRAITMDLEKMRSVIRDFTTAEAFSKYGEWLPVIRGQHFKEVTVIEGGLQILIERI